jgi:enoyl-CoA hydratase
MLEHEVDGPVHLLRLAHGKVNAMDIELVAAVTARVGELAGQAGAVVLTGTGAVFSAGVDLRRVVDGGTEYGERFLPALADMFDTVFGAPVSIVAAINGWAIAGGACSRWRATGASSPPRRRSGRPSCRWACRSR